MFPEIQTLLDIPLPEVRQTARSSGLPFHTLWIRYSAAISKMREELRAERMPLTPEQERSLLYGTLNGPLFGSVFPANSQRLIGIDSLPLIGPGCEHRLERGVTRIQQEHTEAWNFRRFGQFVEALEVLINANPRLSFADWLGAAPEFHLRSLRAHDDVGAVMTNDYLLFRSADVTPAEAIGWLRDPASQLRRHLAQTSCSTDFAGPFQDRLDKLQDARVRVLKDLRDAGAAHAGLVTRLRRMRYEIRGQKTLNMQLRLSSMRILFLMLQPKGVMRVNTLSGSLTKRVHPIAPVADSKAKFKAESKAKFKAKYEAERKPTRPSFSGSQADHVPPPASGCCWGVRTAVQTSARPSATPVNIDLEELSDWISGVRALLLQLQRFATRDGLIQLHFTARQRKRREKPITLEDHIVLLDPNAVPPGLFDPRIGFIPITATWMDDLDFAWLLQAMAVHYGAGKIVFEALSWSLGPDRQITRSNSTLSRAAPGAAGQTRLVVSAHGSDLEVPCDSTRDSARDSTRDSARDSPRYSPFGGALSPARGLVFDSPADSVHGPVHGPAAESGRESGLESGLESTFHTPAAGAQTRVARPGMRFVQKPKSIKKLRFTEDS